MNIPPSSPPDTDLELLTLARNGQREAYGQLVAKHQTLVASLAYSICGDFRRSQDIAQEAFVSAWQQLGTLQDPSKFKSWLCGITRNLSLNFIRQQSRQIDRPAVSLDNPVESVDETPSPHDQAVTHEEAVIVWQALEKLPETYREPLILFYREHHSIERVAAALDLSEDTVKQRLSRGRAMLRDQVESVIDRSLGFTTPGVLFTTTVMSALPMLTAQITATTMAGAAAKGGAASKAGGTLPWVSSLLTPFLVIPVLSLLVTAIQGHFAGRYSRSPEERKFMQRVVWTTGLAGTFAVTVMLGLSWWKISGQYLYHIQALGNRTEALIMVCLLSIVVLVPACIYFRYSRRILDSARNVHLPEDAPRWRKKLFFVPGRALIYQSKLAAFGLPLLDIRFGHSIEQPLVRGTAVGWIAAGDVAHGIIFALGGVAVGGIAIGGMAIGALSIGYVAIGLDAFGFVAVGFLAKAIFVAIGYIALGTIAVGWEAASGVVSVAKQIASGMITAAANTNAATTYRWEEANPIVSTLVPTKIVEGIFFAVVNAVISLVGMNTLARYPRGQARPGETTAGFLRHFALPPAFLSLFTVSLVCFAFLFNAAIKKNSRRLAAESTHASEAKIKTANDEIHAKARHKQGKKLARAGQPAEALAEFLWCFDEGMAHVPGLSSVRSSYLLDDIQTLSVTYPPAKASLLERRDRAQAALLSGQATDNTIKDIVALNRSLNEADRSLALYDQLPAANAHRTKLRIWLFSQFLKAKRYDDALQSEPVVNIFRIWPLMQSHEISRNNSAFTPAALKTFHDYNLHWLADRLEVLAGAGQLDHARELLATALAYDGNEPARAIYHAGLLRAGHAELLASTTPAAAVTAR